MAGVFALIFLDMLSGKKYDRIIGERVQERTAVIIVAHRAYKNSCFLKGFASELADRDNTVIVVTKSLGDGLFPTARVLENKVILIREAYFFRLRRALARSRCKRIIMVD